VLSLSRLRSPLLQGVFAPTLHPWPASFLMRPLPLSLKRQNPFPFAYELSFGSSTPLPAMIALPSFPSPPTDHLPTGSATRFLHALSIRVGVSLFMKHSFCPPSFFPPTRSSRPHTAWNSNHPSRPKASRSFSRLNSSKTSHVLLLPLPLCRRASSHPDQRYLKPQIRYCPLFAPLAPFFWLPLPATSFSDWRPIAGSPLMEVFFPTQWPLLFSMFRHWTFYTQDLAFERESPPVYLPKFSSPFVPGFRP